MVWDCTTTLTSWLAYNHLAATCVAIAALTDDFYRFDRAGHVIHGLRGGNSYRLGDPVRVAVAAVDVDRRELDFRLLGRLGKTGPERPRRAASKQGPAKRGGKQGPAKRGGKQGPRKRGKKRRS